MVSQQKIRIQLTANLFLEIFPEQENSLFEISEEEAETYSEACYQVLEGKSYEYAFTQDTFRLEVSTDGLVTQFRKDASAGRIIPNIYVGTLTLYYFHKDAPDKKESFSIEVL